MIVECSSCETRFRLDESRVPPRGIRVRCSRCKQAFFLEHPSASETEATHDVVAQAAAGAALDFTQDLLPESSVAPTPDLGELDEEDWEFNQDPPDEELDESSNTVFMDLDSEPEPDIEFRCDDDSGAFGEASDFSALADEIGWEEPPADTAATSAQPESPASAPVGIEDVGEPEDWDFFSDASVDCPAPLEPTDEALIQALALSEADAALGATGSGTQFVAAPSESRSRHRTLRGAGRAGGWLVTVALCILGIGRGVFQTPPAGLATAAVIDLGDLEVGEIRAVWLETARATRMYVVHGRLLNDGSRGLGVGDVPRIVLLSSQGERLEVAAARSGLPLSEEQLRLLPAQALAEAGRNAASLLAATRLEPGQAVGIQAFFDVVPDQAMSFVVEVAEPLPAPEDATTDPPWEAAR
ncbi:MAG: zinc-ribbon domain-containing protein [Myxococcota bacterium]|nr:zinc-ribbon domain-containing protein [Myxococcota bacterium]